MSRSIASYPEHAQRAVVRRRMLAANDEPLWGLGTWAAWDAGEHVARADAAERALADQLAEGFA